MELHFQLLLLFGVGLVAGFINVMAGGGSAIAMPILIFMGLDGALANGTNRLAIFIQNISAILSFRQEKVSEFRLSFKMAIFALPGAILGAILAVNIDSDVFKKILGVIIIGIIITTIIPKKAKNIDTKPKRPWLIYPVMFAIGFYGGFMQIGVGFIIIAALQNILKLGLVRVNMHKVFIIFLYNLPALIVFILNRDVKWEFGLVLATGNALGAWISAKVSVRRGEKFIRIVLIIALGIISFELFDLF